MPKRKKAAAKPWVDPDDAPELPKDWFERADIYIGDKLIKRGRDGPSVEKPKSRSVKTGQFAKAAKRA
jgi:hypothetical protein